MCSGEYIILTTSQQVRVPRFHQVCVFFGLYTEILGSHNNSGSVSSAVVSTAGTICDGSVTSASNLSSIPTVENFINTGPVPIAEQTFTTASGVEFTVDMIKKFEKRFENGYNIYINQTYVQWLRIHHPDHLPTY